MGGPWLPRRAGRRTQPLRDSQPPRKQTNRPSILKDREDDRYGTEQQDQIPVSYTHLDVYKRQSFSYTSQTTHTDERSEIVNG